MKRKACILLIGFVVALACLVTLPGCSLLAPSVEKAREIAEMRQAEAGKAFEAYAKAAKDLEDVVSKYQAAVSAGDTTAAQALLLTVKEAVAKYESAKAVAESTKTLFESAVGDFKNAKSASDYIGTVLGWLGAGLGALFGAGGMLGKAKSNEALGGVSKALEKVKNADGDVWPQAKADMQATLSTGALKLIEKLRP